MTINKKYYKTAITKAQKSHCKFKISVICLNKRGELIGVHTNTPGKFNKRGAGNHAEQNAISKHGGKITTMILFRVNPRGDLLPIEPCNKCKKLIGKYNVKLIKMLEV
jgi:cytidine deaminase